MKKLILFSLISLFSIGIKAQDSGLKGAWTGKLNVYGNELTLVFHFDGEDCTLDSPDQGVKGVPAKLERTITGIKVAVPSINASYEGVNMGESIMGTFKQHGQSFPLTIKPGLLKRNRPQTPAMPYPYQTQEVSFNNGDAILKGTLVIPENASRQTPVLLMVTGSGLQNRDEEIFEHKPFAVIADVLARAGIATLRYDDRGFGESTGDIVNCTTEDLKNDAFAGVQLLRSRFDKVGVIGHSEGGTIALMLAAEKKVDFIVSLAGMAVSGKETLLWQNRLALAAANIPSETIDVYCNALDEVFDACISGTAMPSTTQYNLPTSLAQNLTVVTKQLQTPYMKQFLTLDSRPLLGNITCPVLALNGSKDTQVDSESNLGALRSGLQKNAKNKLEAIEGVNHLFQHCKTGMATEYGNIEETIAPEVLEKMVYWLSNL
jgi:pimeloyl-ACP methyl ester carboxylesterase